MAMDNFAENVRDKSPPVTDPEALAAALAGLGTMSPRLRKLYDEAAALLRAQAADGRRYTQADLLEAVKTERHACSICVWMVLQDALAEGADDKGLEGWMREAEERVKRRLVYLR
jgi:hypothetical protein